jgi:hypothetical protein
MRVAGCELVAAARWNAVAPGLTLEQQRRIGGQRSYACGLRRIGEDETPKVCSRQMRSG